MSDNNKPNGGFPPIYRCSKKNVFETKDTKSREFKGVINTVSIKDILTNRAEKTPFI